MSTTLKPEPAGRRTPELPQPELLPFLDVLAATIADQIVADWSKGLYNKDGTASDEPPQPHEWPGNRPA